MDSVSYTAVSKNLSKLMDQVCNDHAPVETTSLEEFQALEETTYLLRLRANSIKKYLKWKLKKHK